MGLVIKRATGSLGLTNPTEDAVICMLFTGVAVAGKIALSQPVQIFSADALATYGIIAATNPVAFKDISDFYAIAGEGAELNFMLVADTTSLTSMCDIANNIAKKLIDFTDGRGVVLLVNNKAAVGYTATIDNGFDADLWTAMDKANALCEAYDDDNIPLCAVLPGFGFTTAEIADMPLRSTLENDYVAVNCHCEKNDHLVSQGLLAGWLAKYQVHENVGDVSHGKMCNTAFFPDATPYITLKASIVSLASKGLIVPVKRGQKSGFYYYDDPTMTAISSDYSSISWNRTINKAKRIAADILLNKLNGDIDENPDTGKIETTVISDWESDVENAIRDEMMTITPTKKREISGIKCIVDPNSDILNNEISGSINVVRKGQSKDIVFSVKYVAAT